MLYSTSDLHTKQREILNRASDGEEVIIVRKKIRYQLKRIDYATSSLNDVETDDALRLKKVNYATSPINNNEASAFNGNKNSIYATSPINNESTEEILRHL